MVGACRQMDRLAPKRLAVSLHAHGQGFQALKGHPAIGGTMMEPMNSVVIQRIILAAFELTQNQLAVL